MKVTRFSSCSYGYFCCDSTPSAIPLFIPVYPTGQVAFSVGCESIFVVVIVLNR